MSMGYEGYLVLDMQYDKQVVYKYACGNVNKGLDIYRADIANPDGIIVIDKSCFVEPEIHQKLKRTPSGRKRLIEKRIRVPVDYEAYIQDGRVTVQNASACWRTIEGIDFMALRLLHNLFKEYQEQGGLPERVSIYW